MQDFSTHKCNSRISIEEDTNEPQTKMGCIDTKVGTTRISDTGFTESMCEFKRPLSVIESSTETLPNLGKNKVALKPGRSLMDWIRFTHSGTDLTSVGGCIRPVTKQELSKHDQKSDGWICLKGKVYNVTHYLEYHPGGEEELMKGFGKDATDLFNEVHRWVNAESMLQKCFIGPLKCSSLWLHSNTLLERPKFPLEKKQTDIVKQRLPKLKWTQTTTHANIAIKSYYKELKKQDIILDLTERHLLVKVILECLTYIFHMELEDTVFENCRTEILYERAQLEISLEKKTKKIWKDLGVPLSAHDTICSIKERNIHYRPCTLLTKEQINHNTLMLSFKLPSGTKFIVPVGYHINIKMFIEDAEIVRSYTPVVLLDKTSKEDSWPNVLHFIIKVYVNGVLTPVLKNSNPGDDVMISDYIGSFDSEIINSSFLLILLSAGTGISPMIRIIKCFIALENHTERKLKLACFNEREEDILWRDALFSVAQQYASFSVSHVLSHPTPDWKGESGHISKKFLLDIIGDEVKSKKLYVCICGSPGFSNAAKRHLEDLGVSKENFHIF